MGPSSTALIVALLGSAVAVAVLVGVLVWRRAGRPPASRPAGADPASTSLRRSPASRRAAVAVGATLAVLASQVLAVAGTAAIVNRQLGFYPTWESLAEAADDGDPLAGLGGGDAGTSLDPAEMQAIAARGWAPHPIQPPAGAGAYRDYLVTGARSRTKQKVVIWVPPGHERDTRFTGMPVLLVAGGAYVTTDFAVNGLHLAEEASALISTRKVKPFVAVIPEVNIKMPRDTECADYPGGPQAYTWLAQDVPQWATTTLGVPRAGAAWSVMGWSLGGYCAAKLHVDDPQSFPRAATIQGFFAPEPDGTTGSLALDLRHDATLRHRSDIAWMLLHQPPPTVRLLVMSSPQDPQSWRPTETFLQAVAGVRGVQPLIVPNQGHTLGAWRSTLPTVLPYLVGAPAGARPEAGRHVRPEAGRHG